MFFSSACTYETIFSDGESVQEAQEQQQQQEPYEIEQWLVEFANLFRDQLGVEPDRHLDLQNLGWEKLQAALDTAVLDDKAPALFDQAAERFQEVTAHGSLSLLIVSSVWKFS